MKNSQVVTRSEKFKEYRNEISHSSENPNNVSKEIGEKQPVHSFVSSPKEVKQAKKRKTPYSVYRSRIVRKNVLYFTFALVASGLIVFGILSFANYLGLGLW